MIDTHIIPYIFQWESFLFGVAMTIFVLAIGVGVVGWWLERQERAAIEKKRRGHR